MAGSSVPAEAPSPAPAGRTDRDISRIAAKVTASALAVTAVAFGIWQVRTLVILLLLALTLAASMRPGVEWLCRHKVPQNVAILFFFVLAAAIVTLFFWFALPPAIHEVQLALHRKPVSKVEIREATGIRHDVLVWLQVHLSHLPSGSALIHPIATYGQKATSAIAGTLFTLAATWYWVSERDSTIDLLTHLAPREKREKARQTYLTIDHRLGVYTRVKFLMVVVIGALLSLGFYLVGLDYWLLAGGFVSFVEIVPVIGPVIGALFVLLVGLPQGLHVALMSLLVVVGVRTFQSYVINPHLAQHTVGLSPLVTLVSVSVVGLLFGSLAVILAIPAVSAAQTLIDVFVLGHDPPPEHTSRRSLSAAAGGGAADS